MKKLLSLVLALVMMVSMASASATTELKELNTYETAAREIETLCVNYTQAAVDIRILLNCLENLLASNI